MKKFNTLLLLCLTISFFSCSKNDDNLSPNNSIVGKWELIKQSDYLGGDNLAIEWCAISITFNNNQTLFLKSSCGDKNGDYIFNGDILTVITIDDSDNTPFTDKYNVLKLNDKTLILQPFWDSMGGDTLPEERDIFEFMRIN